jgi:hypothetical protein
VFVIFLRTVHKQMLCAITGINNRVPVFIEANAVVWRAPINIESANERA